KAAAEMPDRSRVRRVFSRTLSSPQPPAPRSLGFLRSSMARRAARQLLDLVLGDQLLSELELIGRRRVIDAEDRGARAHVAFRMAMAVEAPFHLERVLLPHERHA